MHCHVEHLQRTTLVGRPFQGLHSFKTSVCQRSRRTSCQLASSSAEGQHGQTQHGKELPATLGRRHLFAAATLLTTPLLLASSAAAAGGIQTFTSSEGFAFDYPPDWVVAFDRSGGKGNGAVMVAGNFRTFDTVSVFRTDISAAGLLGDLDEETGYRLAVQPQQQEASTMRFQVLRSSLTPAVDGGSYYDYEYQIETCRGEIIESAGGKIDCLGPQGQDLDTLRRHHLGRALVAGNYLYTLNASAPEDRWQDMSAKLAGVVRTFRR